MILLNIQFMQEPAIDQSRLIKQLLEAAGHFADQYALVIRRNPDHMILLPWFGMGFGPIGPHPQSMPNLLSVGQLSWPDFRAVIHPQVTSRELFGGFYKGCRGSWIRRTH